MSRSATGAAARYLPHEFDAVLLDRVWSVDAHTTRASARVRPGLPFGDEDGAWPSWLAIELMAQAVAAGVGLAECMPGVRPRLGLLLGVRDFTCTPDALAPGTTLLLESIESTRDDRGMGVFDCAIEVEGIRVARATLSVYLPDDVDDYLRSVEP